jgi:hypothetical protein
MGLQGVLTNEEDGTIATWVLNMQMVGLSITFQQFKLKGVEITQTRPMPFQDGVQGGSW